MNLEKSKSTKNENSLGSDDNSIFTNKENIETKFGHKLNFSQDEIKQRPEVKLGFWEKFKTKIVSIKDSMKYNILTLSVDFYFNHHEEITIFSKNYNMKTEMEKLYSFLQTFIYISYRSDFTPIYYNNKVFTTDCGWGCMLRSAQMMLANAINTIKLHNKVNLKKKNFIESIILFYDSKIDIEHVKTNYDFRKYLPKDKDDVNSLNTTQEEQNQQNLTKLMELNKIFAPFSIQNIAMLSESHGVELGSWYSDGKMANILKALNNMYKPIDNFKILNFTDGVIYEDIIIKECFKKIEVDSMNLDFNKDDYLLHNDQYYEFENIGMIFFSRKVGIEKVENYYFKPILDLFDLSHNTGIIGGRGHLSIYMIGKAKQQIIYLDPHRNQKTIKTINTYQAKDYDSYFSKNFYSIDVSEITPQFTLGLVFKTIKEYRNIINSINKYEIIHGMNSLIKYRTKSISNEYLENQVISHDDDF